MQIVVAYGQLEDVPEGTDDGVVCGLVLKLWVTYVHRVAVGIAQRLVHLVVGGVECACRVACHDAHLAHGVLIVQGGHQIVVCLVAIVHDGTVLIVLGAAVLHAQPYSPGAYLGGQPVFYKGAGYLLVGGVVGAGEIALGVVVSVAAVGIGVFGSQADVAAPQGVPQRELGGIQPAAVSRQRCHGAVVGLGAVLMGYGLAGYTVIQIVGIEIYRPFAPLAIVVEVDIVRGAEVIDGIEVAVDAVYVGAIGCGGLGEASVDFGCRAHIPVVAHAQRVVGIYLEIVAQHAIERLLLVALQSLEGVDPQPGACELVGVVKLAAALVIAVVGLRRSRFCPDGSSS